MAGLILLAASLAVYLYALLQRAYFVASLAMIVLIAGLIWYLLGASALPRGRSSGGAPPGDRATGTR